MKYLLFSIIYIVMRLQNRASEKAKTNFFKGTLFIIKALNKPLKNNTEKQISDVYTKTYFIYSC